ncbi:MAG: DNA polymerase III subunit alpha [Planctomycetota bacterium]|nr:DNA polymerase III subunit alpha [Planctomycetota bacterium]
MADPTTYTPLRVHGHHSLLTGVDSPAELCARARRLGIDAMALADVDSTAGLVDFLEAARDHGVRPIVAAELSDPCGEPGRLVALVRDRRGYRNLLRLVSARRLGYDPGAGRSPDASEEDFDLVHAAVEYGEGLVFLADHPRLLVGLMGRVPPEQVLAAVSPAALGGARDPRPRRTRNTHLAPPRRAAPTAERAPEDGEWPDSPKTPPPARCVRARELVEAARATGFATLAVPDVYHVAPGGAGAGRVRAAIKHNALLCDLPEAWLAEAPAHLPAPAEVSALYAELPDVPGPWGSDAPAGVPPMVARTLAVAEGCRYLPPTTEVFFPEIELEAGESAYSLLCRLAFDGARRRYRPLRPEVLARLEYELSTIDRLGFAPYFLLVKRIADHARAEGVPCVGRGSAADSLVAYCLRLTDADPLRYGLLFERFLNPSRSDRPDIDLDFCWRRRDEIIEHVYELFGHERTAMISTLNTFGPRAAVRETALAEGIPPAELHRWTRVLPYHAADTDLRRVLRATPEARDFPFADERWARVLDAAPALFGVPRHFGLHPGGVVVSPGPITDFVACQRAAKGVITTQLDKDAVEAVGLVKMDLLGNRALTVLDDGVRLLREGGIEVDLEALDEADPPTGLALSEGRTLACFQVESPGMRNLLRQTGAGDMDAVIEAVALIRPGPAGSGMKDAYVRRFRGLEAADPPHPDLAEVLGRSQGVMLYQEDVMQVAATLAGMDLAEADLLRRALQKRRTEELQPLCERFVTGCVARGVAREDAERVWELVSNFASFGFCKAHAVTYGRIAYRTVWLKTHHPAVYMAAFLASETGYYERRVYVEEARRLGVAILPPDVNRSAAEFTVEWRGRAPAPVGALRVGLGQVKGLSQDTLDAIARAREEQGPFLSLPDFLDRTRAHTDQTRHLIQCGAFDAFDHTRPQLLWRLHLLRTPPRRPPRTAGLDGRAALDPAGLAACSSTPKRRTDEIVGAARDRSRGWRAGPGLGDSALEPGASATLFPEPAAPALALPGLPDTPRAERGRLEYDLLGLTVHEHPTAVFPCPADERIAALPPGSPRRPARVIACAELGDFEGGRVTLRGWPAATRRVRTSRGEWMRFVTLEDETGLAEAVLFPDVYRRDGRHLAEFGTLCVSGIVRNELGACCLEAERVW